MGPIDAIRNYFESMVTYRISSIISTLTRLQIHLLTNKDRLTLEEMDTEINRLEDMRRSLRRDLSGQWDGSSRPPQPPQSGSK